MELPLLFEQRMRDLLGAEWPAFQEALQSTPPVSLRLNPRKAPSALFQDETPIPWATGGYYLPQRPVFTLDPLFHAGAYYVQEASSMLIEQAVRQFLDLTKPLRALDLCAAPGGKSTHLLSLISEDSFLVANEVIRSRHHILRQNLEKWGYPNAWHSQHDSSDFKDLEGFFDLVLVDAPCSGEGLFRKDPQAIEEWSADNVQLCCGRQKRILADAAPLVRPGGLLLYSTCTYNQQENRENTEWLQRSFNLELLPLQAPEAWGVRSYPYGVQAFPHRVRGEGFFLACFRRPEEEEDPTFRGEAPKKKKGRTSADGLGRPLAPKELGPLKDFFHPESELTFFQSPAGNVQAFPTALLEPAHLLASKLPRFGTTLEAGTLKGSLFIPSHALALSTLLTPQGTMELTREEALAYLSKGPLELPYPGHSRWQNALYQGLPLGWLKHLKNRINNYFPKEWRIRMDVTKK